ncbi:Heavy metal-associated isoprenylated plant protein 36 [Mucuna pruriens]|uniref:Heavy metal-associated isoprenylated plant protein 36 n=1 Tax=Mucuna pruriens TaxID=157652 RepID=A0A371ESQ9_MUCPR|nr:Heavy metal-associated isoprenylated plant protein 36 [Mucuna pruriens]
MAAKAGEEAHQGETLKYKTWVLKVLIHCDGCKKRTKKILQGIDGVYTTEVDSLQHKVTVTGNVDAETLIKRLSRSGKLVELWPEKPAEKKDNKKSGKSKGGDVNKGKQEQKNSEPEPEPVADEGCKGEDSDKEGHSDECEEGNGGGEGGKKKKKKKKKGKNSGSAPPNNGGGEEISKVEALVPSNLGIPKDLISPPIQHAYPYPHPHVYYSPPPAYGLSYNTSYPISSASYYVGAPIMPMHAYSRFPPPPPPSDPIKHHDDEDEYEGGGYCSIISSSIALSSD